jgi:hypothetical protein
MICPNCRKEAPTISRGLRVYCTVCGAPRSLLNTGTPVNVAGRPTKAGGTLAAIFGWVILLGGLLTALLIGAGLQALWPAAIAGYVLGGFIGGMSLLFGLGLILGGRKLRQSGEQSTKNAQEEAVFALAARRGGSVTPAELARSIRIPVAEADALLTALAKQPDGRVSLEVEDDGTLRYFVRDLIRAPRMRVEESDRARARVPAAPDAASADDAALAEDEALAERDGASAERRRRR